MDVIPGHYVRAYSVISAQRVRRLYHDAPDSLDSWQTLLTGYSLPNYWNTFSPIPNGLRRHD